MEKNKVKKLSDIIGLIKDGSSLIVAGFYEVGRAETILEELYKKGTKGLDIVCNDIAIPGMGVARLVMNNQVKKLTLSFIGANREINDFVEKKVNNKEMELNILPQGSLIEKIRAGGYGLGGILTPTGVGTLVEEGKKVIEVEGKKYLLETPIKADFALIRAQKADISGNLICSYAERNFNPCAAAAGKYAIAEVDMISKKPLHPNNIQIPNIFVNAVVRRKKK